MSKENEENFSKVHISWYPGHMAKTKRQIIEDLKLIDVIIELLDARIPNSSQNPDIAEFVKNNKRIIILNKADLADKIETEKWIESFRKKGIKAIAVDSNQGKGINQVEKIILEMMKDEINQNATKGRIRKTIRVMILGIPNVGKSSFINRISKKTTMAVGNKPGVTRQKQWIRIGNQIELLDTPGVLWPKFESDEVSFNLAFTGAIKDDVLDKEEIAYYLIKYLDTNYSEVFRNNYNISSDEINNIKNSKQYYLELMELIGRKRGALISGGRVDTLKVAGIVLDEFRSGKIGKISLEKAK